MQSQPRETWLASKPAYIKSVFIGLRRSRWTRICVRSNHVSQAMCDHALPRLSEVGKDSEPELETERLRKRGNPNLRPLEPCSSQMEDLYP